MIELPQETTLSRRANALRDRMGEHPAADLTKLQGLERERGWLEAIAHLSRHGGLSHSGSEEARKMIAASEEWFEELTDDCLQPVICDSGRVR